MWLIDKAHKLSLEKLERRAQALENRIALSEKKLVKLDIEQTNKFKELMVHIVHEAFEPSHKFEDTRFNWREPQYLKIRGTLDERIRGLMKEHTSKVDTQIEERASIEFDKLVNPEEFIDNIVKRIKMKQLP
jgi:hypothetical protein